MDSIRLSELTERVQETIKFNFGNPVWIRAEISELRENSNGHCYLEFVEKDAETDFLIAKCKATIWNGTYRMLKPYFESTTGQEFRSGLKVLVAVTVDFHSLYGFSLNVKDIDPVFTVGDMMARRLQIIRKLEEDGIADMNKLLPFSERPQRIAIISSATAAGYGDFMDQLRNNPAGFVFYTHLFSAIVQGEQAEASMIAALDRIYEHADFFDIVAIIRGGGATTDLACFDSYQLALNCAQFPLPVVAGIGHQRDVSILDMVANTSVKTPTAVAALLLEKMQASEDKLMALTNNIYYTVKDRLRNENDYFGDVKWRIRKSLQDKISARRILHERHTNRLRNTVHAVFVKEHNLLMLLEKNIESHSPAFLLKYGYTLTTVNGVRLKSVHDVKRDDVVRTYLHDGNFESKII